MQITPQTDTLEPPFIIELIESNKARNGTFTPRACLKLTKAVRTSGLWLALPSEDAKNFLLLLTFLTANGDCSPTVHQLSHAMQVAVAKVHKRMQRLTSFIWQGEPLVRFFKRPSGLDAYSPNPKLFSIEHREEKNYQEHTSAALQAAGREAVVAFSREHYTHPRVEVEASINQQLGHREASSAAIKEESEYEQTRQQLLAVGLTDEQAAHLLESFHLVRIRRQLAWLAYRQARNKAGLLIAAIEDDYEAPPALRRKPEPVENTTTESHEPAVAEAPLNPET